MYYKQIWIFISMRNPIQNGTYYQMKIALELFF